MTKIALVLITGLGLLVPVAVAHANVQDFYARAARPAYFPPPKQAVNPWVMPVLITSPLSSGASVTKTVKVPVKDLATFIQNN